MAGAKSAAIQRKFDLNLAGKLTKKGIKYLEVEHQDIRFTGYSYGDENDYECLVCGQLNHTYSIRSTTLDEAITREWLMSMSADQVNYPRTQKMIGIMYAGGRWYGSHSGARQDWIRNAMPKGVSYVNYSDEDDVVTWGGSTVARDTFKQCWIPGAPGILQCAGAKLARHVASFGGVYAPIYMTEIWVDPQQIHQVYTHQAITDSCDTCREQIATIMCPYTPSQIERMWRDAERDEILDLYRKGDSSSQRTFKLLQDMPAYTARSPTRHLGFTLKQGAQIVAGDFGGGYYRVVLVSGGAFYHSIGSPTIGFNANTPSVPPIYMSAEMFVPSVMDLA